MLPLGISHLTSQFPRTCLLVCLSIILGIIFLSPLHASVVRHSSIKYKFVIWAEISTDYSPENGDYVLVSWIGADPNDAGLKSGTILAKRIGCLPGERVRLEGGTIFWCEDRYLGTALGETPVSQKRLAPYFFDSTPIAEGFVFLIGDTSNSYDSRYLGPVPVNQIYGRVVAGW